MKIWQAVVTSTSNRNIKVSSSSIRNLDVEIKPLYDGRFKLPPPDVNEEVWVIQPTPVLDDNMRYVPIDRDISNDTSSKVQIDTDGDINFNAGGKFEVTATSDINIESSTTATLEALAIKLGALAVEPVVKGTTLVSVLTTLITVLSTHTHTTTAPGAQTPPPTQAAAITAVIPTLTTTLSTKSAVE